MEAGNSGEMPPSCQEAVPVLESLTVLFQQQHHKKILEDHSNQDHVLLEKNQITKLS